MNYFQNVEKKLDIPLWTFLQDHFLKKAIMSVTCRMTLKEYTNVLYHEYCFAFCFVTMKFGDISN